MTEGLEPLDKPSMDTLTGVEDTEAWSSPGCSTFDDVQPGTMVFRSSRLSTIFPRPTVGLRNGVVCGEHNHQTGRNNSLCVEYGYIMKLQRVA